MKQKTIALSVLAAIIVFTSACSQDIGTYNAALDADRNAREKMTAALSLMAEADALAQDSEIDVVAKHTAAVDAFKLANASWVDADRLYKQLIQAEPQNGDYNNNLGNMIYFRIMSGLEGNPGEARQYLEAAIAISDRPTYKRNLELLEALDTEGEANEQMLDNRRLVGLIKALAGE